MFRQKTRRFAGLCSIISFELIFYISCHLSAVVFFIKHLCEAYSKFSGEIRVASNSNCSKILATIFDNLNLLDKILQLISQFKIK